jgi:hypothetical protein
LIEGMTIHKGLGIKVKSKDKGKGNRKLGDDSEDYSVFISVQNRTQLRDGWRSVDIAMLDECSLTDTELLSEVDCALRFAKEKPDQWFGGIIVIFAGDLYQYPPVGGTALYTPIAPYTAQTNKDIAKRLGRLAWKSVNAVVTLTEQERMKGDPQYARAVNRLRTRECTLEDMELFNSRVIKSATNEDGIDMGLDINSAATAIVHTNLLRETLNLRKAQTICRKNNVPLTMCAAVDKCATRELSRRDREQLLKLNMSSSKVRDGLPGFIPLYTGMPVVLRTKNISTDLGIMNGSQGFVRSLQTAVCPEGFTYCTCVLVEFPDSNVTLPGLPKGYFPIVPVKSTFTTQLVSEDGTTYTIRLTRSQLPVQPGFAVTGQSAQGKTLPCVLANLHEGGFGAYVAASRARNREGLCITEPVTLQQLNKLIPHSLLLETKRLAAIEHNTYIRYGFSQGILQTVPDPEGETEDRKTIPVASFDIPPPRPKRNRDCDNQGKVEDNKPSPKRQRISNAIANRKQALSGGCTWSEADWSCAYDSVLMIVFYAYLAFNTTAKDSWKGQTQLNVTLAQSFDYLISSQARLKSPSEFDVLRDRLRDFLTRQDPHHFPRRGPHGAPADLIFDYLTTPNDSALSVTYSCTSPQPCCPPTLIPTHHNLPKIFSSTQWREWCLGTNEDVTKVSASVQTWIDLAITSTLRRAASIPNSAVCDAPCSSERRAYFCLNNPPPILVIEVTPGTTPTVLPSNMLKIPSIHEPTTYMLRGIIYLGQFHFTARLIDPQGLIWCYDGRKNGGVPWADDSCCSTDVDVHIQRLNFFDSRSAYLYIYNSVPQ